MRPDTITMTMRQLDRLKVLQALADGHPKTGIAATRLGLSPLRLRGVSTHDQRRAPPVTSTSPLVAARLKGSKVVVRDVMGRCGAIPTGRILKRRPRDAGPE